MNKHKESSAFVQSIIILLNFPQMKMSSLLKFETLNLQFGNDILLMAEVL